jgi:hypothetical protein
MIPMRLQLQWHEYVGLIGVALCLLAYFGLQAGRLRGDGLVFQLANVAGASAIAVSLLYDFNLSAMVIEIAWIAISLYGIARSAKLRRTRKTMP